MKHSDIAALMKGMAPVVRDLIVEATRHLAEKIVDLERELEASKAVDHSVAISAAVAEAVASLPTPKDGKDGQDGSPGRDADAEQVRKMVEEAIAAIPLPKDGVDGRDGADGKDGADGHDGKDGADGRNGTDGQNGKDGADGLDGVGLADAVIDRDGALVLTMTDGRTKALGLVIGKDGVDGHNGDRGRDGNDGVGFDDMDVVGVEGGLALRFSRGDVEKLFPLPVVIDCGVYRDGGIYRKGNGVTWGGSFWIAQKDSPDGKPDTPDSGWRLAVKRGQNGRDAVK